MFEKKPAKVKPEPTPMERAMRLLSRRGYSETELMQRLRRAGLVGSVRGPGGGYRLGRVHSEIDVAQIIDAVNETYDTVGCQGIESCDRGRMCLTQTLWYDLSGRIHSFLSAITLADLVSRADVQRVSQRQDRRESGQPGTCALGDIPLAALS